MLICDCRQLSPETSKRTQLVLSLKMEELQDPCECVASGSGLESVTQVDITTDKLDNNGTEDSMDLVDRTNQEVAAMQELAQGDVSDDNCTGLRTQEARAPVEIGESTLEQNGNGKIPNRDSGIDSPSCNGDNEVFPNEETMEEKRNAGSVETETENEMEVKPAEASEMQQKIDCAQEDDDSDMDDGSSEENEPAEVSKTEETAKVGWHRAQLVWPISCTECWSYPVCSLPSHVQNS